MEMVKRFKKGLILVLLVVLTGCQVLRNVEQLVNPQAVNQQFYDFLSSLDDLEIDPAILSMPYAAINPTTLGKKAGDYQLKFSTRDDYNAYLTRVEETLSKLKALDDSNFTTQELTDKAALIDYFENSYAMKDYYDFEMGETMIAPSRSFMGALPTYLETYSLTNQNDVDAYFNFLETLPDAVEPHLAFERERQQRKTGFSQESLKTIAFQYEAIATAALSEDYFLIRNFDRQIDAQSFPGNKQALKQKHRGLIQTRFALAYQKIANAFNAIEGTTTVGLAHKPGGKAYYEHLLQRATGKKQSIEAIEGFLLKRKEALKESIDTLPNAQYDAAEERYNRREFGSFGDGYELLAFLEKASKEDYPDFTMPTYTLRQVDPTGAASTSPALYLTKSADVNGGVDQIIYINGSFNNADYPTYAHEGVPGHMYQYNYFKKIRDMHPIRFKFSLKANSEGWANYVENRAVGYVSTPAFQTYYQARVESQQIANIEADIGIHYHGWSLEEFATFAKSEFELTDLNAIRASYLNIATNPTVAPMYYLSSLYFEAMREATQVALGDAFDVRQFHKAVLSAGSASFDLMQQQVDDYLKRAKR